MKKKIEKENEEKKKKTEGNYKKAMEEREKIRKSKNS